MKIPKRLETLILIMLTDVPKNGMSVQLKGAKAGHAGNTSAKP
jgi:hypothetical protein